MIAISAAPYAEKAPEYADLMPIDSFVLACKMRALIGSDGYGEFSDGVNISDIPFNFNDRHEYEYGLSDLIPTHLGVCIRYNHQISPSDVTRGRLVIPSWATHVAWYNR